MAMEKQFIQEGIIRSEMDNFLRRELDRSVYCGMDIHKTPLAVRINLYVEKPPIVIGKKGSRINKLTKTLQEKFGLENLSIDVQRVDNPMLSPEVIANRVATALERRIYRRRVVYRAIRSIMRAGAKGVEITLSGKIVGKGGRSRVEKYSEGYMKKAGDPTKLVREGSTQAYLKAGVIGVNVKIVPPDAKFPNQIEVIPPEEFEEDKEEAEEETEKEEKKQEKTKEKAKKEEEKQADKEEKKQEKAKKKAEKTETKKAEKQEKKQEKTKEKAKKEEEKQEKTKEKAEKTQTKKAEKEEKKQEKEEKKETKEEKKQEKAEEAETKEKKKAKSSKKKTKKAPTSSKK